MLNLRETSQSSKITISLPVYLLDTVDVLVQEKHSNRSAVIAEILAQVARERFEAEMRAGYEANASFARQIAEEDLAAGNETWPEY